MNHFLVESTYSGDIGYSHNFFINRDRVDTVSIGRIIDKYTTIVFENGTVTAKAFFNTDQEAKDVLKAFYNGERNQQIDDLEIECIESSHKALQTLKDVIEKM
jgi:hypothetical protein